MLPITRATIQTFCRVCLRELPTNAASSREPNHDINKNQLFKLLQSISGVTMKSSQLSLYPQSICHSCYVKTNAFLKFRDKAIVATGVLKMLVTETLQDSSLLTLKTFCRVCLRTGHSMFTNCYKTEKDGEVYNYMHECVGLQLTEEITSGDVLKEDSRFPSHLCARCYATLKNFVEFRGISRQTEEYLRSLLDGVPENQEESKRKTDQTQENETHEKQDTTKVPDEDIVVKQLPICSSIKVELSDSDNGFDVDYDYEMPIEVQINSDMHDGDGIDLDAVEIKKELDTDDDVALILKSENVEPSVDDSLSETPNTNDEKRSQKKRTSKIKDEFEIFDSQSTESDDDSDFETKKRSKKQSNKRRKTKQKSMAKINEDITYVPQTRSGRKANIKPANEIKESENSAKTDNSLSSSSEDDAPRSKNAISRTKHSKGSRASFKCTECNKNFYKKYMFEAHMKGVHQGVEKPFDCQYCESSFRLVQLLNRHVNAKHALQLATDAADDDPLTSNLQNLHVCVFCQRPFRRKDHLKEHIRAVHEGLRPFECKVCNKTFGSRNTQLRHEKNHSETRPYACEFCAKRYNSETELKVHIQRHTTSPDLLCPICKRGKPNAEELQKHIAMHEASRQHQCPKCGKVFTKLFHLREHDSAVHLKLRPFKCNLCDLTFGIRKTLKTHERRHDSAGRPEFCSKCNLYFKTKRALLLHIKKTHPEDDVSEDEQETTLPGSPQIYSKAE